MVNTAMPGSGRGKSPGAAENTDAWSPTPFSLYCLCLQLPAGPVPESARWSASTVRFEPARLTAPQFPSLGRGCCWHSSPLSPSRRSLRPVYGMSCSSRVWLGDEGSPGWQRPVPSEKALATGPRDSHWNGFPHPPSTQPFSREAKWAGRSRWIRFLKNTGSHMWQDSSDMGSEPAGTWSGLVSSGPAGSSHYPGGTLQAHEATPRKVTRSGRLSCVCLSQTDYLTLRGPTPPARAESCSRPPCPINHLFIRFEAYSCSFATSSPTCRGASRGRHPHSCTKAIRLLLHGNKLGRLEIPPASALELAAMAHPSPPTPRSAGRAGIHPCLCALQPTLPVRGDEIQSLGCLLGACKH